MRFTEAVRSCFRNYATFSGRARRPEYWWFVLFVFLGTFAFALLDSAIFGTVPAGMGMEAGEPRRSLFSSLFQLATLVPLLAVGWRRLHDSGRPGWYLVLPLGVTLAGVLVLSGAFGASVISGDPAAMGLTAMFGLAGLVAIGVAQIVFLILLVWWLTRPTQPGPNRYGPEPAAG